MSDKIALRGAPVRRATATGVKPYTGHEAELVWFEEVAELTEEQVEHALSLFQKRKEKQ